MGPKGPLGGAEGCNPPQELEKAAKRATFLVHKYYADVILEQSLMVRKVWRKIEILVKCLF